MANVLLIIHLFVTLALIGVVLIQRSEGGGLGIGSSQGMGGLMTGRGTANLLTRATAVLATVFMLLSLALALLNRGTAGVGRSRLDTAPVAAPAIPGEAGRATLPATPAVPSSALPSSPPATSTPAPAPSAPAPSAPAVPTN